MVEETIILRWSRKRLFSRSVGKTSLSKAQGARSIASTISQIFGLFGQYPLAARITFYIVSEDRSIDTLR